MARAALPGRLTWQLGRVIDLAEETPRTRSIALELPAWTGHRAGQHVDVRLTAPDGYEAQRSYSIASAPDDEHLLLTVERLDDGEVSPYLAEELQVGDELELRGPIGGYFVWDDAFPGPVLLVAGGSGIVPFRAMLRHRRAVGGEAAVRLLYSTRSLEETIYRGELSELGAEVELVLTRHWPEDWQGRRGRIDRGTVEQVAWPADREPVSFICGPTVFVELAAQTLVDLGHDPGRIKTERFGPTG